MARVIAYVDGFNLYYGLRRHPGCKWLNVEALMQHYVAPGDVLDRLNYFTAHVKATPVDPGAPGRQQVYLRALRTLTVVEIHFGKFTKWRRAMPLVAPIQQLSPAPDRAIVMKVEEKGSDVALGARLVADAYEGRFDHAIVVSNDTDLCPPIEIVRSKGLPVTIVNPYAGSPATDLRKLASGYRNVRQSELRASQFADPLIDGKGRAIRKPVARGW